MNRTTDSRPVGLASERRATLFGTLPLIVLTGALFFGAYLTYLEYPRVGAGNFPLWGLSLTLGFIAAIGAVVSWFFATDGLASPREPAELESTGAAAAGHGSRADFGRPVPEVPTGRATKVPSGGTARAAATPESQAKPWDEDVLPPVAPRGPRPLLTTLDDPGEIGRALQEIADIQRELAARQPPARKPTEAPTRA